MEITNMKRSVRLQQWGEMIQSRQESGLTVDTWCQENGISKKTYYYRLRKVRLAALNDISDPRMIPMQPAADPVFAELKLSGEYHTVTAECGMRPSVLVTLGAATIGINNGADPGVVANVIRVVREIC